MQLVRDCTHLLPYLGTRRMQVPPQDEHEQWWTPSGKEVFVQGSLPEVKRIQKQLQRDLISTHLGYKHTGCANGNDRNTGNWRLWALLWLTNHYVTLNTCTAMRSIEVWLKWVSILSGMFVDMNACTYVLGDVTVIMSSLLCCCRREMGLMLFRQ